MKSVSSDSFDRTVGRDNARFAAEDQSFGLSFDQTVAINVKVFRVFRDGNDFDIVTSGDNMAIHAAANIAMAVEGFKGRGYAELGGVILNRRNVKNEDAKVAELAEDIQSEVIASLSRSDLVQEAEEMKKTVIEAFPDSEMAQEYRELAKTLLKICGVDAC